MNLSERLLNPRKHILRKWLLEMLGSDRYVKHDQIVDRIGSHLVTSKDVEDFGKLSVELFEAGYMKCLNDYRGKLQEMGIGVNVVPAEQPKG